MPTWVLLDEDLNIEGVIARGQKMMLQKQVLIKAPSRRPAGYNTRQEDHMILETKRLYLRELTQADFKDLAEILQDPGGDVRLRARLH